MTIATTTTNNFGQVVLNTKDAIDALYKGGTLDGVVLDDPEELEKFNTFAKFFEIPGVSITGPEDNVSQDEFDTKHQKTWFMPDEYLNMDIETYLLSKCKTSEEITRINIELEYFRKDNSLNLLRYLRYFVDTMRENDLVWGVGRGSSVSSYSLYLLGVHKVNSIKYKLPMEEFFKN